MRKSLLCFAVLTSCLSSSAQSLGWAKAMGSTADDRGFAITLDASGNVYTAGYFSATADFDPGSGVSNLTAAGMYDAFVCKLDASGNFVWAKAMGGTGADGSYGVALDAAGNVYITGGFEATVDFDPGAGTSNLISAGGQDIFVCKLDASGNFVWAKRMGGTNVESSAGITTDNSGNVITTGFFQGTADFDPGAGTTNSTSQNAADIFVSKLDGSGNFVWAKTIGGTSGEYGRSITSDGSGNLYLTGDFTGTVDFDPGAGTSNLITTAGSDIFVSKLDAGGNFVWAKQMVGVGTNSDKGYSVDTDASGNVYATGYFLGTVDFDPGAGTTNLTVAGNSDIFVCKLDGSGNFVWAKAMGGTGLDAGATLVTDASGNIYTAGAFNGTADFDPGAGTFNLTAGSLGSNIYVSKLDGNGNFVMAAAFGGGIGGDAPGALAVDGAGNIYSTGVFLYTPDFDPGPGTLNISTAGAEDVFVHKMGPTGTGIPQQQAIDVIRLFPNPTSGKLFINYPYDPQRVHLEVYNVLGEKILQQQLTKEINFSGQPKGVYFVKIFGGDAALTEKVILQN